MRCQVVLDSPPGSGNAGRRASRRSPRRIAPTLFHIGAAACPRTRWLLLMWRCGSWSSSASALWTVKEIPTGMQNAIEALYAKHGKGFGGRRARNRKSRAGVSFRDAVFIFERKNNVLSNLGDLFPAWAASVRVSDRPFRAHLRLRMGKPFFRPPTSYAESDLCDGRGRFVCDEPFLGAALQRSRWD